MGHIRATTHDELSRLHITHTLGLVDSIGSTIHQQHRRNEPSLEENWQEARDEAAERMREKAELRDADAVLASG